MRELLAELTRALDRERPCVYCSVIETRGSTPQKAGAAMLVFPDGSQAGTLGGGCCRGRGQTARPPLLDRGEGASSVLTFCLDDNYGWTTDSLRRPHDHLSDPLAPSTGNGHGRDMAHYYRTFHLLVEAGDGCTEAVAMTDQPAGARAGNRWLFDANSNLVAAVGTSGPDEAHRHLTPSTNARGRRCITGLPISPFCRGSPC